MGEARTSRLPSERRNGSERVVDGREAMIQKEEASCRRLTVAGRGQDWRGEEDVDIAFHFDDGLL